MSLLQYDKWTKVIDIPLNFRTCQEYGLRQDWKIYDAIILSIGYMPPQDNTMFGYDFPGIAKQTDYVIEREFRTRWNIVDGALSSGELKYHYSELAGKGGGLKPFTVDAVDFILWLKKEKLSFPPDLEEAVMRCQGYKVAPLPSVEAEEIQSHASDTNPSEPEHNPFFAILGGKKGLYMRDFVEQIQEYAMAEIERGCRCSQVEIAERLMQLRLGNGSPLFPDPRIGRKVRKTKKPQRPIRDFFVEAASNARKAKGLLRQGEKGYAKVECKLHTP